MLKPMPLLLLQKPKENDFILKFAFINDFINNYYKKKNKKTLVL